MSNFSLNQLQDLFFPCPLGLTTSLSPRILVGRARIRTCAAIRRWIYRSFFAVKVFPYFLYILYNIFYKKSNKIYLPVFFSFRTIHARVSIAKKLILLIVHRYLPPQITRLIIQTTRPIVGSFPTTITFITGFIAIGRAMNFIFRILMKIIIIRILLAEIIYLFGNSLFS